MLFRSVGVLRLDGDRVSRVAREDRGERVAQAVEACHLDARLGGDLLALDLATTEAPHRQVVGEELLGEWFGLAVPAHVINLDVVKQGNLAHQAQSLKHRDRPARQATDRTIPTHSGINFIYNFLVITIK